MKTRVAFAALLTTLALAGPSPARAQDRGTNVGGTDAAYRLISSWAPNALAVLSEHKSTAAMRMQKGDLPGARGALFNGLEEALKKSGSPDLNGSVSLTFKAIERARDTGHAIEEAGRKYFGGLEMTIQYLLGQYDFIARIGRDVELPCAREPGRRRDFERRYVEFAARQLLFLTDRFLIPTADGGVGPKGPAPAYLKALEFATAYAAEDIHESLWSYAFEVEHDLLEEMSRKLAAHNAGNLGYYTDDRGAVNLTNIKLQNIIDALIRR